MLFLKKLNRIVEVSSEEKSPFSGEYRLPGLRGHYWLVPISEEGILEIDWGRIIRSRCQSDAIPWKVGYMGDGGTKRSSKNNRICVSLTTKDGSIHRQLYDQQADVKKDIIPEYFDFRIWPNCYHLASPRVPQHRRDRRYYFRIRQKEEWRLEPLVLALVRDQEGRLREGARVVLVRPEVTDDVPDRMEHLRRAVFCAVPAENAKLLDGGNCAETIEPIGLYFRGRGLIFFRLNSCNHRPGLDARVLRVGVDFGTSNSCVVSRTVSGGVKSTPQVVHMPNQTSSFFVPPTYYFNKDEVGNELDSIDWEGASAVLDFPAIYSGDEKFLSEDFYFPSQMVTRCATPPAQVKFDMSHGLILPRNDVVSGWDVGRLLEDYADSDDDEFRVFRLIHRVKWENKNYRRAFLWHLYRLLTYYASREGSVIGELAFSYPRAFDRDAIRAYGDEIDKIFCDHGGVAFDKVTLRSESRAVISRLRGKAVTKDCLFIDVGGGTTDFGGIQHGRGTFQASYELAASALNLYFQTSPSFRVILFDAVSDLYRSDRGGKRNQLTVIKDWLDSHDGSVQGPGIASMAPIDAHSQSVFFSLLSVIELADYPRVSEGLLAMALKRKDKLEGKVLRGLFMIVVILYAALVFQGIRLFWLHKRGSVHLGLDFIGNGSRYLALLGGGKLNHEHLVQRLVRLAYPKKAKDLMPAEIDVTSHMGGKSFVAEGLVLGDCGLDEPEVLADLESCEIYRRLNLQEKYERLVTPELIQSFLRILDELLPGGRFVESEDESVLVVPGLERGFFSVLSPFTIRIPALIKKQVLQNATRYCELENRGTMQKSNNEKAAERILNDARRVEPVFVTAINALLGEISSEFAN